jgi:cytochrome oxidase assembly protein ShyY1
VPALFTIGGRTFAPRVGYSLLTLCLCALFLGLGRWQWQKGNLRESEWERFSHGAETVVALDWQGLADVPRFQLVSLIGRFDGEHQFLLDNRTHDGRAGYEVLTPLQRPDGRVALVDRGWVPFTGLRDRLPGVALRTGDIVTITGRTDELPVAGLESGRAAPSDGDRWPKVTSYPTLEQLSAALKKPLESRIVLLDAQQPDGYVREWQAPGMPPMRHWSYAIQWWAFAALALVLWVVLSAKRPLQST